MTKNNNLSKAIENYIKVKECVNTEQYSPQYVKACIGLANVYNSVFDIENAVNNLKEALNHGIEFKVNNPEIQMKIRDGIAIAVTNFKHEGSVKTALQLEKLAYLTSQSYGDDDFKIKSLRQLIYLNTITKNTQEIKNYLNDLKNIASVSKECDNYILFGEIALSISRDDSLDATKKIQKFQNEYVNTSPNFLKEQFLHLKHLKEYNTGTKDKIVHTYKGWTQYRDSVRLDFYKNFRDSLQVRYQKRFVDEEMHRLRIQQDLNKSELEYKNKNIFYLFIIVGLLLLTAFLTYYFLKKTKQQKKLVENLQKELHHRMKNNLSFIDLFINLAKGKFQNPAYQSKLNELQNRMHSMFEVHKQLFKKDDITTVKAKNYIDTLVENVQKAYAKDTITISNTTNSNETILANTSFPVGLIVNEFVTNSYKYAFEGNQLGTIDINLISNNKEYQLVLKDNGKGLPTDFDINNLDSFGLETIQLLTKEYGGTFALSGKQGVTMNITLPKAA